MIEVLRGSRTVLRYQLFVDGVQVPNLGEAEKVCFAMKSRQEDTNADSAVYVETGMTGIGSSIACENGTGTVLVTLDAAIMEIPAGRYFYALQVEWSPGDVLEFVFDDGIIQVNQDTIRIVG